MIEGLVGRIPIYTSKLDLFAYDLRLCSLESLHDQKSDEENAYGNLLNRTSKEVQLDQITGNKPGFIKMPGGFLKSEMGLTWPKDRIVLNIDEQFLHERNQFSQVSQLASQGYRFIMESQSALSCLDNIPEFASFWSFDAGTLEDRLTDPWVNMKKKGMRLLARNIVTSEQFNHASEIGFDYFQGRYFELPKPVQSLQIPANRIAVLNLLAHLQDPEIRIQQVEELVSKDITLSYKLLRLLNSAYFGLPKKVDSLQRAVVFFGLQRIKNWTSVLVINSTEYKPKELLVTALVRARTCEVLAQKMNRTNTESYYITGLFSVLDAIMDIPMPNILESLNLVPEIDQALLERKGEIGETLHSVLCLEQGHYYSGSDSVLTAEATFKAYLDAIAWTDEIKQQIGK